MRAIGHLALVALAFGALAPTAAIAGPVTIKARLALPSDIENGYRQNLLELRRAALEQREKDGGTLTAANIAKFQERLDKINSLRQRSLYNNDPLTLNADGSSSGVQPGNDWTYSRALLTGTSN